MGWKSLMVFRAVAFGFALAGVSGIWYWSVVWNHYYDTLPRSPQPKAERVYPMNMHGVIAYATRKEHHRLELMENGSYGLLFVGFVGSILTSPDYWRKMGWRYPDEPSSRQPWHSEPPGI
jgi:hypothetical protein